MSRFVFKLPDLGEGAVDAEIVAWRVKPGDVVAEDDPLVEVMTEKATLEVPAPVSGRVISVHGEPGERRPVGAELAVLETAETSAEARSPRAEPAPARAPSPPAAAPPARAGSQVLAAPATRRLALEAGIDLAGIAGSGPHGRILREDVEAHRPAAAPERAAAQPSERPARSDAVEEIAIRGVRRIIAERLSESARTAPHFSYVEEVDVTELERLRTYSNAGRGAGQPPLTYLPFLILALVRTLAEHPGCNAVYDAERGVLVRHKVVHVGVATQTPQGLKVPVIRDAGRFALEALAQEIHRVSEAARTNTASRAELAGSTITVTSLGRLGGIASTPILNIPEVAIIGVNRAAERPVVHDGALAIRRMMNLSSSFDHRFVDGHDGAAMIQTLKARLEHPATIFMD